LGGVLIELGEGLKGDVDLLLSAVALKVRDAPEGSKDE
jgi:hypothetical protein